MELQLFKLGDICNITSSKRIFANQYINEGIPFYRSKEIIEKKSSKSISEPLFISKEVYENIKNKFGVPTKNDILLTSVGTLGIPYLVKDEVFYFKDGNLTWMKDFSNHVYSPYIYYWLASDFGRTSLIQRAIGSSQGALTIDILKKYKMVFPNFDKQQKIVSILVQYDQLIENNTKRIKLLEKAAEELYKEWFVRFRFPGYENAEFKHGIPKGWELISLEINGVIDILSSGIKEFSGEKTYLATADVDRGHITNDKVKISYLERPSRANMQPEINTIWFAKMKNSPKYLIVDDYHKELLNNIILSTGFAGLNVRSDALYYVYSFISSSSFNTIKDLYANGSTQEAINNERIRKIKMIYPEQKYLVLFNEKVKSIYKAIYTIEKTNQNLSKQRDLLLPRLMSGKLEVK